MLSKIDRSQHVQALASAIRKAITAGHDPARSSSASNAAVGRTGDGSASLADRVKAIPSDHPSRHREAIKLFLEATLLAELGKQHASDPAFHQLVEDVVSSLQDSPEFSTDMDKLSKHLLGD